MQYRQIPPPAYLKHYVRYFWTLENSCRQDLPKTFGPLADGCPGLIFQQSDQGIFYDQTNKQLPGIFLYGQTIHCSQIHTPGSFSTIGVYFQPTALRTVFGLQADELTNTCIDAGLLPDARKFSLSEQLLNAPSTDARIAIISAYLYYQLNRIELDVEGVTQYALSQIIKANGNISLKDLQADLHLSERTFERKFRQSIGIAPKLYARVCQFQAAMQQLRSNQYSKLSDIAFENGYADHSHFTRTFREFTGLTPYQFQQQSRELVANFPELLSEQKEEVTAPADPAG